MPCGCVGIRKTPRPLAVGPFPGELGFLRIISVGEVQYPVYGEKTNSLYPFNEVNPLLVDIRDATVLLGVEFHLV